MRFKVHYSFIILFLIAILTGLVYKVFILLVILILHELGHLLMCKKFKREIKQFTLLSFGGVIDYDDLKNVKLHEDMLIILGGLLVNLIILLIGFAIPNMDFFYINKMVLFFNIIPIWPLDGGRIIEVFISKVLRFKQALLITNYLSIGLLVISLIIGIKTLNMNLLVVIAYLGFENFNSLKNNKKKYETFLLKKHLYPNDTLKKKVTLDNSINGFYRGVNNIFIKNNHFFDEKRVLEEYFKDKTR